MATWRATLLLLAAAAACAAAATSHKVLVAGGLFTNSGSTTVMHITQWDGTAWTPLGAGTESGYIHALVVHNNEHYTGFFNYIGSVAISKVAR